MFFYKYISIKYKTIFRTKTTVLFLFFLTFLFFSGCASGVSNEQMKSVTGFYFDTVVTIQAVASDKTLTDALEKCRYYEELLSRTVEGSDVWNINHAGGESVKVSSETMEVLRFARTMAEETNGAFDITVAPAADAWDFNADSPSVPDEAVLKEAVSKIGYKHLQLDEASLLVTLDAGSSIDLGGIAKGFIADKVGEYLEERGVKSGILNFGGNVLLIGKKQDGTPWRVGVQDPEKLTGEYIGVISYDGSASVVTSGTYERGFVQDGVRYHHILDPKTGYPVQNTLAGVTILTESSMVADAYSTACFVLGPEAGLYFAEQNPEVEVVFVFETGETVLTEGMQGLYATK